MDNWKELIPEDIRWKYDLFNYGHAVEILKQAYPREYADLCFALKEFTISTKDILEGGGNESEIPKRLSAILVPREWREVRISGDLLVRLQRRRPTEESEFTIYNFIDGHNIDYVKDKIAIDFEWNSKDQTFDRDLFAFRTFYDCGIISCGIIITRSDKLNEVFAALGCKNKYGASTTWMGKLTPRIEARRHGGCPILAIGITPKAILDWEG